MGIFSRKTKQEKPKPDIEEKPAAKGARLQAEKKEAKKDSQESMKDLYRQDKPKAEKKAAKKAAPSAKKPGNAYRVLIRPLVTEKAATMSAEGKYAFAVAPEANKIEVAEAINEVYGVAPRAVNIIKVKGKQVRYGRITGQRKNWKKAIVTLPQGQTIDVYEGV